jgi:hypothetical protein
LCLEHSWHGAVQRVGRQPEEKQGKGTTQRVLRNELYGVVRAAGYRPVTLDVTTTAGQVIPYAGELKPLRAY